MILDCLKLLLVWYLLSSEICLGCVKRTTKRALNYRLQVAKDKVGSDRYRLENYNTLHLVEVDSTKNQICNSTSFEMFAQKVQPQWFRQTWQADTTKEDGFEIYPPTLDHYPCCPNSWCDIKTGASSSVPGVVMEYRGDTVILKHKYGNCNKRGYKIYEPVRIQLSKSCHCVRAG